MKITEKQDAIIMTNCTEPSNFIFGAGSIEPEFNEFKGWELRIKQFEQILKQLCEKSFDSFFNAVLWRTYFKIKDKNATFDRDLQECLGTCILQKLCD